MPGLDMASARHLNHAQIGLSEIGVAATDYPLLFMKDIDSGHFRLIALFGLKPGTSLFAVNGGWQATYLPLTVLAAPFYDAGPDQVLCIDEESNLISTDFGAALFSDDGSDTPELARIRAMLDYRRGDLNAANVFVAFLVSLDLIRPLSVTLVFENGDEESIDGLYSIHPTKVKALDDPAIIDLQRREFLDKIHIVINAMAQINRIQQLHNMQSPQKLIHFITEMETL